MARFCPKCGAQMRDNSQFCPSCGTTVRQKEVQLPSAPAYEHICVHCGATLRANSKFCPVCGKTLEKSNNEQSESKPQLIQSAKSVADTLGATSFTAPDAPGEFALGSVSIIPNTADIITGGFKNLLSSFKTFFKNPKAYIPTLAISLIWLTISILRTCKIAIPMNQLVSTLTFANAGSTGNPLSMLGGLFGKGVYAGALVSLVYMIGNIGKGKKLNPTETLKTSFGFNSDTVWSYILGAGLAIVLFVFMAGWVSYTDVMGGVAASFLSARSALSGGFLNKLMASIESKSEVKALKGIPSGLAAGFALGTLLGFIPNCNSWLWIAGAVITLGGAVMLILQKTGTVKLGGKEAAL